MELGASVVREVAKGERAPKNAVRRGAPLCSACVLSQALLQYTC